MTDEFERRLRSSFSRADLPMAPDSLRAFVGAVPTMERARPDSRTSFELLRLVAVVAVIALAIGGLYFGYSSWLPAVDPSTSPTPSPTLSPTPGPTASPQPTPSPSDGSVPLPATPADLLAELPNAVIRLERSEGPTDRPISEDATIEDIGLDRLTLSGDLVLAGACLGPGEMTLDIRIPAVPGGGDPFQGLIGLCDGHPKVFTYRGFDGSPWDVQLVTLHVSRGASWRLAAGELPVEGGPAPSFAPIAVRDSWWPFWEVDNPGPVEPEPGLGVAPIIPDDVTTLAIHVQCSGEQASLSVTREGPTDVEPFEAEVDCTTGEPYYVELPVTAGEPLSIWVKPAESAHVRFVTEVDAMPVSTYGPAPELPAAIAEAPFVTTNGSHVAMGTLGGERQVLVPRRGVAPVSLAAGTHAALYLNTPDGSRLELYDVSSPEPIAVLAEHPAGEFIITTWVDAGREQVFYTVRNQVEGIYELHRVGFDGSGRQRLLTNPDGPDYRGGAGFLGDELLFDVCGPELTCDRQVIDAATLQVESYLIDLGAELCDVVGATDTHTLLRIGEMCQAFGADDMLMVSFDDSDRRLLPDVGPGSTIKTSEGWAVLYKQSAESDEYHLFDIESGESRTMGTIPTGFAPVTNVSLPEDWIMFAPWYGIGDFPASHLMMRGEPPILLNVVGGEVIELANLPH